MSADLKEALTPLALKLGEGAEHVYELAIRQSYVEGLTSLILCLVMLVLIAFQFRVIKTCSVELKESSSNDPLWIFGIILAVAGVIACFIIGIFQLIDAIRYLGNPEYMAIKDLLVLASTKPFL
jgi:hypothetical protein